MSNEPASTVTTMNERLWSFAQQIPCENKFQAVLKLELLRKSLKHDKIDTSEYNVMCRKCHLPWSAGFFTVEVIPGCKRSRKQIEQLEGKGELTKQQQSLVKYLRTRIGRTAKFTCQICSYKTRIQLDGKVKLPERKAPAVLTKEQLREEAYQKWLEESQRKRKNHGKSTAGLKVAPKPATNVGNGTNNRVNSTASGKNKGFTPTDFRIIQKMLESQMASKDKNSSTPKANQPTGRLRLSRN